jgi:hypothetical protein
MDRPQQQELERSGRGDVDPQGRRVTREADRQERKRGGVGKVPSENRPGHRPKKEQDKPHPAP